MVVGGIDAHVNEDGTHVDRGWEEAEVAALNRPEWRRSVAQCIHALRCGMNQDQGQEQDVYTVLYYW